MLCFAYDGSINGDWVSHYALRLALHHPAKTLRLIHIRDGLLASAALDEKLERIAEDCRRLGVAFEPHIAAATKDVLAAIDGAVPTGQQAYLVCGTRVRAGRRGLLAGTISEGLLSAARRNVLAVRVMQPGVMGLPRELLLPVSGHPQGFQSGLPFLRLLAPDVTVLHLLYVQRVGRLRFRFLSHAEAELLREPGQEYGRRIEAELTQQLDLRATLVDAAVIVSDDVPKEIVIHASRLKSRLIYLGASERNLRQRLLYGNPIEQILRDAPCDVAVYRGAK
jgi:nucleotide-binding universal stress UspA family protein